MAKPKLQRIKPLVRWLKIRTNGKHIGDIALGHNDVFLLLYNVPHVPGFNCLKVTPNNLNLDGFVLRSLEHLDLFAKEYSSHCQEIGCRFYKTYGFNCYTVIANWVRFINGSPTDGSIHFQGATNGKTKRRR